MRNRWVIFGFAGLLLIISGCAANPEIRLGDEIVASHYGTEPHSFSVISDFENPLITGLVPVVLLDFGNSDGVGPFTCCSRIDLGSDQEIFGSPGLRASFPLGEFRQMRNSIALSITEPPVGMFVALPVYAYKAPNLALPPTGEPVDLRLLVNGEEVIRGTISLSQRVIVIPVHVHLISSDDHPIHYSEFSIISGPAAWTWFERPSFSTRYPDTALHRASNVNIVAQKKVCYYPQTLLVPEL